MAFFYALSDDLRDPEDPYRFLAIVGFGPEHDIPLPILFDYASDEQRLRLAQTLQATGASHLLADNAKHVNLSAVRALEIPYEGENEMEIAQLVCESLEEMGLLPEGSFRFGHPDEFSEFDEFGDSEAPDIEESFISDPFLDSLAKTHTELVLREGQGWRDPEELGRFVDRAHDDIDLAAKRRGLEPQSDVMKTISAACEACWVGSQQLRFPDQVRQGERSLIRGINGLDAAIVEVKKVLPLAGL